jgi:hypothetical protein
VHKSEDCGESGDSLIVGVLERIRGKRFSDPRCRLLPESGDFIGDYVQAGVSCDPTYQRVGTRRAR